MKLPLFVSKRKELTAARKTQVFCLEEIKAMFPLKLSVQDNDTSNYREKKSVFNLSLGTSDLLQLLGSTENIIQLRKMSKSPNCLRHNHMKDLPTGIATSFCVCCKLCSFVIRIKVDLFKQILYMIKKDLYSFIKISISNNTCICYLWKCKSWKLIDLYCIF